MPQQDSLVAAIKSEKKRFMPQLSREQLEKKIENAIAVITFPAQPRELYEPVQYMLSLGGKRIRPLLLLMACDMFKGNVEEAVGPAMAVEVFHNFTLLHDDIMDNAPLRRSKETVHKKWNRDIAILSGDAMFIQSVGFLQSLGSNIMPKVLKIFTRNALIVCEGQQVDMNFEKSENVTIDNYIRMIQSKTAALIGCSLQIGALTGGASDDDAEELYKFGSNLGVAFQLRDDLLDVYGDEKKTGKQIGGDIIANKKTFLFLKTFELCLSKNLNNLYKVLNNNNLNNKNKIDSVKNIYDDLNIKQHAQQEIEKYYNYALSNLAKVSVHDSQKIELKKIAESLISREA